MGALVGLCLGLGLFLVWRGLTVPPRPRRTSHTGRDRLADLLTEAGIDAVTPGGLVVSSASVGVVVLVLMMLLSESLPIAVAFGVIAAGGPVSLVRYRARQRRSELRELWPEVVDNLASGVRAGLSLPEALSQLGERGPEELRRPFQRFGEDYRATGRFFDCLDRLKLALSDPVGDRLVESLRMARQVGGSDLGRLLRTLSAFLREDARTRAELETRQGWTVNAARLAVAAPWIVLGLVSLRPEAVAAYNSTAGLLVLAVGGMMCALAYRLMVRIGRLPEEERVLR
jgi:tight adherence protein B